MEELALARLQFGITTTYHFLFVPLTMGLSVLIAIMETIYVRTGNEIYREMAKFWGKLFLLNFTLGVVTGLVLEFQFGMNWSEYARFMGDIFGVPLALEALTAFFFESVFLGLWIFGWERLSAKLHAAAIWIVALATNLSALWIMIANAFMQAPVGFVVRGGRAEMTDFGALITNPYMLNQYPHAVFAGLVTAGVFVMAISAYHLLRSQRLDFFRPSFKIGVICALAASLLVAGTGHRQGQVVAGAQPMKLAAMEALWETADPAPFTLVASIDQEKRENLFAISIPRGLSLLAYNSLTGEVKGLKDLQAQYAAQYGAGNYLPPVAGVFWSFRIMTGAGAWLIVISALSAYLYRRDKLAQNPLVLKAVLWTLPVPYIANLSGWFVTEMGRQPWIVFGLQRVDQAISPVVSRASLWTSLLGFTLLYGILTLVGGYLLVKQARTGPGAGIVPDKHLPGVTLWS